MSPGESKSDRPPLAEPAPDNRPSRIRFGLALSLATVVHLAVLLGIDFIPEPRPDTTASMDITLVQEPTPAEVDEADQYAEMDSEGEEQAEASAPDPEVRADALARGPRSARDEDGPATSAATAVLRAMPEDPREGAADDAVESMPRTVEQPETVVDASVLERPRRPSAAQLIQSGFAAARTSSRSGPDELRRTYITSRTKEHVYASYMDAWRRKVEQVGNMNYPEAAREQGLYGNLILDVAINADGSVREINLRRSSGHAELDEAAERIVRLAAPFAPLPDRIREHTDVLHITRTWQFRQDNRLQGR